MSERLETCETEMPWLTYTYSTPAWVAWLLGRVYVDGVCCICGERERMWLRMPRWGPVPKHDTPSGRHPKRIDFMKRHTHLERQNDPMGWALPLRNMTALEGRGVGVVEIIEERVVRHLDRPDHE